MSAQHVAFRGEFSAPTHAAISTPFAQVGPAVGGLARSLLKCQRPDGSWREPPAGDASTIADVLMLFAYLERDDARRPFLVRTLLDRQLTDGGWANGTGTASELDATVRAYFALKIGNADTRAVERARERLAAWGSGHCDPRTRLELALFGQLPHAEDWTTLPTHSPAEEWALQVIDVRKPVREIPKDPVLAHLFRDEMHWPATRTWNPLRLWSARRAGQQLREHFLAAADPDGPTSILPLIALHSLGEADAMLNAWRMLDERIVNGNVAASLSPMRDTALALTALREAGIAGDAAPLVATGEWLWSRLVGGQSRGDLSTADSALALVALAKSGLAFRGDRPTLVDHVLHSIFDKQGDDGSWDTPELTGLVLQALGEFGIAAAEPVVADAIQQLESVQEADSAWGDATWRVLAGLRAVRHDLAAPLVRRAAAWLKRTQHAGGGWGDGVGSPAAAPTARALLGLMAAGDANSPEVDAGVDWLLGAPIELFDEMTLATMALAQFERHVVGWSNRL